MESKQMESKLNKFRSRKIFHDADKSDGEKKELFCCKFSTLDENKKREKLTYHWLKRLYIRSDRRYIIDPHIEYLILISG